MQIGLWVFGYGSIIWRPAMPYIADYQATVYGWARRFWQGSHDHRGTIDNPGRVLTLVPIAGEQCTGRVFGIAENDVELTLKNLDFREKNGYERQLISAHTKDAGSFDALTYIATAGDAAWLVGAADESIADQIPHSNGPSGSNTDYVLSLHNALLHEGIVDDHIQAIAKLLD